MSVMVHVHLYCTGYDISTKAMTIMFNRFARKRKSMHLDDFCSCLSRVKIMDGMSLLINSKLWYVYLAN